MATITIAFENLEEEQRRRTVRRSLPAVIVAALGAMALLGIEEPKPPEIRTVVQTTTVAVPVRVEVPVPVLPSTTYGPPDPPPVPTNVTPRRRTPTPPPVPTTTDVATTTTAPTITDVVTTTIAPPPPPAREPLPATIEPRNVHFTSSRWQRVIISNPHAVPIDITSVHAAGLNGAPVRGYQIDTKGCMGRLAPGAKCTITVFARQLALRSAETIEIRVTSVAE